MRSRAAVLALIIGLSGLLGAACSSGDDEPTVGAGADEPGEEASNNDADVGFVQGMIPHHEQAVEMAGLAADRAEDERVLDLATRIEAAQAPEIDQMRSWLDAWGEEEGDGGDHAGMNGMSGMSGMMSEEDMGALEAANGAEFDRLFLEMMTEHHQGAVEMADAEIAEGESPDAIELAETIKSAQEAEIAEMQGLVAEIGA